MHKLRESQVYQQTIYNSLSTEYTKSMDVTGVAGDVLQCCDAEELRLRTTLRVACTLDQTYWTLSRTETQTPFLPEDYI